MAPSNLFGEHKLFIDQQFNPDEDFDQQEANFSTNTEYEKFSNDSHEHHDISELPTLNNSSGQKFSSANNNSVWLNAFPPKSSAYTTDDISKMIQEDQDKLDNDYIKSASPSPAPVEQTKAPVVLPTLPKLGGVKKALTPAKKASPIKLFNKAQERFTISPESQITLTKADYSKIIIEIKNKFNVSIESTISERNGRTIIISGSPENVKAAKASASQRLTKPVVMSFEIPSSSKAMVIGSGGKTIKEIIKANKVQIDVANDDIEGSYDAVFNEFKTLVTLKGPADSCLSAKESILNIVNEHGKNSTVKFDIEQADLFKFSELNTTFEKLMDVLGVDGLTNVKILDDAQSIAFTGSRDAIKAAKAKFTQQLTTLSQQIVEKQTVIKKALHSLIENSIDFENELHVSFTSAEDSIVVKGSKQNVDNAISYIESFAQSCEVYPITISRAHNNNLEHARNILFYLHKNLAVIDKEFKQLVNNNISLDLLPLEKLTSVEFVAVKLVYKKSSEVESKEQSAENIKVARKHLIKMIDDLKPTKTLVVNDIDMNIFGKAAADFLENADPEVSYAIKKFECPQSFGESDDIVLVYIEKTDDEVDFAPSDDEYKAKLQSVNKALDFLREQQKAIASEIVTLPSTVQNINFAEGSKTKKLILEQVHHKGEVIFKLHTPSIGQLTLKGSPETIKEIVQIIESDFTQEKLAVEHVETFNLISKVVPRIIGSKGNNLNQIRNKFDVNIDIAKPEGDEVSCTIKGLYYNVLRAKVHIKSEAKKFADITSSKVPLPFTIRGAVIGSKGANLNKLIEKYQVSIDIDDFDKDCVITGSSKNVEKCTVELSKFIDFIRENSYSETVKVLAKNISRIIGKQGKTIENFKQKYNVEVQFGDVPANTTDEDTTEVAVEVVGLNNDVKEAIKSLKQISNELDNFETRYLDIDAKYFKYIIGPNGSTLAEIYKKCGVDVDGTSALGFIQPVRFPTIANKKSSDSDEDDEDASSKAITLKGDKKVLKKLEEEIKKVVLSIENRVTKKYPEISQEIYGVLIGVGGSTKKTLEETYNVELNIPSRKVRMQMDKDEASKSAVEITGLIENVEACFQEIKKNYMSDAENSVEIKVPVELHAFVSQDGAFINKLSIQKQIIVRHGNKSGLANSLVKNYLKQLPIPDMPAGESDTLLIAEKEHFPVVAVKDEKLNKSDAVPWKLIYEPIDLSSLGEEFNEEEENKKSKDEILAEAVKEVEERIEMAKDGDMYFGFVNMKTGKKVAQVLGANGYNVNKIRYQTGCIIQVPKRNDEKKIIAVYGPKTNVEKAIEMIKK